MSATISVSANQLFTAVRACMLTMVAPAVEIIQAQVNRTPEPSGPDFIVMSELSRTSLALQSHTYTDDVPNNVHTRNAYQPMQVEYQIDVYGPASAENAQVITTLWRDMYSAEFFRTLSIPAQILYANDPRKAPIVNAESQYEARWIVGLMLQCNITISTPMTFSDTVNVLPVNVDAAYPPGA